jgi:hypothetical protein
MCHVRAAGFCAAGARTWLERHRIDLMRFIHQGVPASELEATGDALALRVAAIAREDD